MPLDQQCLTNHFVYEGGLRDRVAAKANFVESPIVYHRKYQMRFLSPLLAICRGLSSSRHEPRSQSRQRQQQARPSQPHRDTLGHDAGAASCSRQGAGASAALKQQLGPAACSLYTRVSPRLNRFKYGRGYRRLGGRSTAVRGGEAHRRGARSGSRSQDCVSEAFARPS
eukprot:SAG31_NODE_64_length_28590_cov_17.914464_10_plen_169_part_00